MSILIAQAEISVGVKERVRVVHGYALMTNHVHLKLTPKQTESIPCLMQSLGRRYVTYVNHAQGLTGTVCGTDVTNPQSSIA